MSESIKHIDPNSEEFLAELEKTIAFTDKVVNSKGFAYNPDAEVNTRIQQGLTRNKLVYGKRYCPCFFVTGNKEEDRICPCKPALNEEIPTQGHCHCSIFCTPEFANTTQTQEKEEPRVQHGEEILNKEACNMLLEKEQLDGNELVTLLKARELGMVSFKLIDVREYMENQTACIKGTDHLVPTTSFLHSLKEADLQKEDKLIVYCHIGSRSYQCQRYLQNEGFKAVKNLMHGIVSYPGEILS